MSKIKKAKTIGSEKNVEKHALELMDRLPATLTSKRARKKALGKMIRTEYASEILDKSLFDIKNDKPSKGKHISSKSFKTNTFTKRGPVNNSEINRSYISDIIKVKDIANAVFYDRVKTYSKSDTSTYFRHGKRSVENGLRFTENEIQWAKTKYANIYKRQINKLNQQDLLEKEESEGLLIRKLYQTLSSKLNVGKNTEGEF